MESWTIEESGNLAHEAALAVTISINLRVELVHQARLLLVIGEGVAGVGVVSISPRTVLTKGLRKPVLVRVDTAVLSKVIVLLAMVSCNASTSGSTSEASASSSSSQLTLAEASGVVAVAGSVVIVTVPGSSRNVVVVLVTLTLANGAKATSCSSANVLGHALEGIVALLAACKGPALVLELIHGHSRQSSGAVVGGLVVVNLVDRHGSVDDIRLDSLLLDNGLDGLMDVVVDVLTTNGGSLALAVGVCIHNALVLELGLLLNKVALSSVVIAVVKLAVLDSAELGSVLFR